MDHNNEVREPEFDLDDILNEFHDAPEPDPADVEADKELEALLHLPELTITPVVVREASIEELADAAMEEAGLTPEQLPDPVIPAATLEGTTGVIPEVALAGDTVMFSPLREEPEAPEVPEVPETPVSVDQTQPLADLSRLTAQSSEAAGSDDDAPADTAPIPEPIPFNPRSRLRELKKQLVAGPEKRYYELTELGTGRLQLSVLMSFVIVALCVAVTTMFAMDMVPENRLRLVIFSQILAMMVSALLASHLLVDSLAELLKGRFTINTLLFVTFLACMADGLFCLKELRIPCCAAFSLEVTMALWARLHRRNTQLAQLDTMRKAVRLHGIVKVEDYFEGMDGLLRTEAEVDDFMLTYDKPTSPELVQSIYCALSLLASLGIAGFSAWLHGISMGVQILSTALLVAVPATFFISTTRPMAILEKRLHMVGTVLCGWEGVKDLCGKACFPLTDHDLFPQGSTKLNGVKFYSDRSTEEVISYTTSMIHRAGGSLVPVFRQLMKNRGGQLYTVDNFQYYGENGIGGEIRGESVVLGSLDFLRDMGVEIPEGTMVSQAVYAAIDGQLCAVYAISYARMRSAAAGLLSLCGYRKLRLLKLPGDFMLTEAFLRAKFSTRTKRLRFPDRETAAQLSRFVPDPQEPVLAIATRDELVSLAYAVTGAKALRQSTKLGVLIHLLGGTLGLVIMLVLGYIGSTELLTPTNILLYQLIWAIPGLLITEWTRVV